MYFKLIEFEITETGAAVNQSIKLNRVVGKVEIVIKDAKKAPADMVMFYPKVEQYFPMYFNIYTLEPMYQTIWYEGAPHSGIVHYGNGTAKGEYATYGEFTANDEYVFHIFMLDNSTGTTPTDLYINGSKSAYYESNDGKSFGGYDDDFKKLVKADLKVYRNKITRLTGNLFSTTDSNNTDIGIGVNDTEWDSEIVEHNFE